jgi:hypothetical protein
MSNYFHLNFDEIENQPIMKFNDIVKNGIGMYYVGFHSLARTLVKVTDIEDDMIFLNEYYSDLDMNKNYARPDKYSIDRIYYNDGTWNFRLLDKQKYPHIFI